MSPQKALVGGYHRVEATGYSTRSPNLPGAFRALLLMSVMMIPFAGHVFACTAESGEQAFHSEPALRAAPLLLPDSHPAGGRLAASSEPTLTILVEFSDRSGSTTQAAWNSEMFGAANSMRDYYQEVSYFVAGVTGLDLPPASETSVPNNNGVAGWYTITYVDPNTATAYSRHPENVLGDGWEWVTQASRGIAAAAVAAADADVNYASFDSDGDGFISTDELHIIIVVAGYEDSYSGNPSPDTWRHHWSFANGVTCDGVVLMQYNQGGGYSMVGELDPQGVIIEFGLVCHEMGHDLGLPDLYDTTKQSEGIGEWGLMGSGDWNNVAALGDSPAHLCAWSKIRLGFVAPTVVLVDAFATNIPQVETNPTVYKLWSRGQPGIEYFLVENRQRAGYDAGLVRSGNADGLLIWHVNEYMEPDGNDVEVLKLVDLECADGIAGHVANADDLDAKLNRGDSTDPWYSGNDADFYTSSAPDNRDYRSPNNFNTTVEVREISASGNPMTADLKVGRTSFLGCQWYTANGQSGTWTTSGLNAIRAYFLGWNCCGNVYVYERDNTGAWTKVNTWCFNVPRHASFTAGNEVRRQAAQWTGQFKMTSWSLCGAGCDQPTDAGFFIDAYDAGPGGGSSGGNGSLFAGWNIGFRDGLSYEFGNITEPMWFFPPDMDGIPLTQFPRTSGYMGVEELELVWEVTPNPYWERMTLQFTVDEVMTPGPILISCPDAQFPETEEWISQPGDYEIYLGWIHAEGPTSMTVRAYGPNFTWDWISMRSQAGPIELLSPPDGHMTADPDTPYDWTDLVGGELYGFQLDDDPGFDSPIYDESSLPSSDYSDPAALADGMYYWRARGFAEYGGWSDWTAPWCLTVDTEPPEITGTTAWPDTACGGPFNVLTHVEDYRSGVDLVELHYRIEQGQWATTVMALTYEGAYEGVIPEIVPDCCIDYYIRALDRVGNESTDPAGAPGECYHFETTVGVDGGSSLPADFALGRNKPNPFGLGTEISYALPRDCQVSLEIYAIDGRRVAVVASGPQSAGWKHAAWDGRDSNGHELPSGVYFYRMQAGPYQQTRKLVLLR